MIGLLVFVHSGPSTWKVPPSISTSAGDANESPTQSPRLVPGAGHTLSRWLAWHSTNPSKPGRTCPQKGLAC
jgi:hypothetical protein